MNKTIKTFVIAGLACVTFCGTTFAAPHGGHAPQKAPAHQQAHHDKNHHRTHAPKHPVAPARPHDHREPPPPPPPPAPEVRVVHHNCDNGATAAATVGGLVIGGILGAIVGACS